MQEAQRPQPPLRLWMFALLMLATASLYQFVWLYRTASELRRSRQVAVTPWHWVVAPLLGPLFAISGGYLATYLRAWQRDTGAEEGHFSEPVLVAMLFAVAYLPLLLMVFEPTAWVSLALVTAIMISLPCIALQHQLNLILAADEALGFSAPAWRFRPHQLVSTILGACLAVPLYIYGFSNYWETRDAATLAVNDVVATEDNFFRLIVSAAGWSAVAPGYLADDAEFEFVGPEPETWAIVYDSSGMSVDDLLIHRIAGIRGDYRKARCEQSKGVVGKRMVVSGKLECSGFSTMDGQYLFVSNVLSYEDQAVEIIGFTAHRDGSKFDDRAGRVRAFVDGLEFIDQ